MNQLLVKVKMTNDIKEMQELAEKFSEKIDDNHSNSIQIGDFGDNSCTTYSSLSDLEDFLFDLGKKIDCKTLITAFKKTLQLKEIISTIDIDNFQDFEELEEEEVISEPGANDEIIIFKYIPSNIFISLCRRNLHMGDADKDLQYRGEVQKKEVTTTQWVSKNVK